jgi:hypothetical protein
MTRNNIGASLKSGAITVVAAAAVALLNGCSGECIDKFDCQKYVTADDAGHLTQYTCVDNKCVQGDSGGHEPDAGSTGGGSGGGSAMGGGSGGGGGMGGGSGGGGSATGGGSGGGTSTGGGSATGGGSSTGGGSATGGGSSSGPDFSGTYVTSLSGGQEVPSVTTNKAGSGTFTLANPDGGSYSLTYNVMHNLSNATGATLNQAFGGLNGASALTLPGGGASPITGSADVSNAVAADIANGHAYVNVASNMSMTGELRGQILKPGQVLWIAFLNGNAEIPSVVTGDTGGFGVIVDTDAGMCTYEGSWPGVTGTMSHIHQGGFSEPSGAVVQNLPLNASGNGADGGFPITAGGFPNTGDGGFYVNVHTSADVGGHIRGPLNPTP